MVLWKGGITIDDLTEAEWQLVMKLREKIVDDGMIIINIPLHGEPYHQRGGKTIDDLTEAEWQLVMMLRRVNVDDELVINITGEPEQWRVRIVRAVVGTGSDFSDAWSNVPTVIVD